MLVSGFNSGTVLRFDHTTGAFLGTLVADPSVQSPHETVFAFDRQLYVASADYDRVQRFSPTNGALLATLQTNGVPLDYPAGMTLGPDGLLYVSSQLTDAVLRYNPTNGMFVDTFVASGSGGLDGPSGIVFGPDGDLYIAGRFANRVFRYNGSNGSFVSVFVTNALAQPFGLRFGPDGHLYVANGNSNHVARFHGTDGSFLGIFTTGGALSLPVGLAFGPDTNLYVANFGGDTVARFSGTTGAFLGNVMLAGTGGLDGPNFITFRPVARAATVGALSWTAAQDPDYASVYVETGTNTGPVWIHAELSDDLTVGEWRGGTNLVVLQDDAVAFRARDALPAGANPQRYYRLRFTAP